MLQRFQDERRIYDARFSWVHSRCFCRLSTLRPGTTILTIEIRRQPQLFKPWTLCEKLTVVPTLEHETKVYHLALEGLNKPLKETPTMNKAGRCRAPRQRPRCNKEA